MDAEAAFCLKVKPSDNPQFVRRHKTFEKDFTTGMHSNKEHSRRITYQIEIQNRWTFLLNFPDEYKTLYHSHNTDDNAKLHSYKIIYFKRDFAISDKLKIKFPFCQKKEESRIYEEEKDADVEGSKLCKDCRHACAVHAKRRNRTGSTS